MFTLAGEPGSLAQAVANGAAEAIRQVDLDAHAGIHPRVGAVDVAPIVYLDPEDRGAACAEALVLGDLLGDELELPVFLYGELAQGRTRAELRRGGPEALAQRIDAGELRPDFGPHRLHPTAGAVLVAARPPLIAFNVELAPPATLEDARAIAAAIREGGPEGLRVGPRDRAVARGARAWPRSRPTSRTTARRRSPGSSRRSPATPPRAGPSSWAWLRGRRSTDSPPTSRSRTAGSSRTRSRSSATVPSRTKLH